MYKDLLARMALNILQIKNSILEFEKYEGLIQQYQKDLKEEALSEFEGLRKKALWLI